MMKSKEKSTFRKIEFHRIETFYLIIRGIEVGIAAGLVSALYRFLLSKAESISLSVIEAVKGSPLKIALWLAALVLIGFIVSKIVRYRFKNSKIPAPCLIQRNSPDNRGNQRLF